MGVADIPYYVAAPDSPSTGAHDDLAAQIADTYGELKASRAKQAAGLEARAAAVNPKLEAVQKAGADFNAEMESRRGEIERSRPVIGKPPTRDVHDFLAPVDGESPMNVAMKLMQGLGIFATGIGGLAKGDATAGLASFKGALEGWREGDAAKADRHLKDWQTSTQAALDKWDLERQSYVDAFAQKNKSLDNMMKDAELEAIKQGNTHAAEAFRSGDIEHALGFLQNERNHRDTVATNMLRIEEMSRAKQAQIEQAAENARERERHDRVIEKLLAAKQTLEPGAFDETALQGIAMRGIRNGGQIPRIYGPQGAAVVMAATKEMGRIMRENGIDPGDLPAIKDEMDTTRQALGRVRTATTMQEAAIRRLDGHLSILVELSSKVPRSEVSAVNDAIVHFERDFKGSSAAQNYVMESYEAGQEYAQAVVSSAAATADADRKAAREVFAARLNAGQVQGAVDLARRNAQRNIEKNRESIRVSEESLETLGGRLTKTKASGAREILLRTDPRYQALVGRGMTDAEIEKKYDVAVH